MPWVNEDMCVGCGLCIEECPVDAISLQENDTAVIDDNKCIRCGHCHEVCPEEAVRHDSERIPQRVEANVQWVMELMQHFKSDTDKQGLIARMVRYFKSEQKVAAMTIERLQRVGGNQNPVKGRYGTDSSANSAVH